MRYFLIAMLLLSFNAFAGSYVVCDARRCVDWETQEVWYEDVQDGLYYIVDENPNTMFEDLSGVCNQKHCMDWLEAARHNKREEAP